MASNSKHITAQKLTIDWEPCSFVQKGISAVDFVCHNSDYDFLTQAACDQQQLGILRDRTVIAELDGQIQQLNSQICDQVAVSKQRLAALEHRMRDVAAKNCAIEQFASTKSHQTDMGKPFLNSPTGLHTKCYV